MRKIKNKTITTTFVLLLILTMTITMVALPVDKAQTPLTKTTFAYIGATPNPVGVGEQTLIHVGITDALVLVNDGWKGLTVTVTKPDGTTETLGPFRTDSTGGTGAAYTPNMVGTYKLQTHFPAQNYTWSIAPIFDPSLGGKTIMYQASDSEILELEVTNEKQKFWPGIPLPTEYWTRPIDSQFREWATISANWLAIPPNRLASYNDNAPETAHILWTKPIATGGLVGGALGDQSFESGDAYEGKFGDWDGSAWGGGSSVIINGVLYYNRLTTGSFMMPPFVEEMWKQQGIVAVDLRTGEELWFKNNTRLTFGQTFYWDSYNYHGTFAYLWEVTQNFNFMTGAMDNTWNAYDAFTGEWAYSMTNVPSSGSQNGPGGRIYGPKGEIYIYDINQAAGWIALWNSSKVVTNEGSWGSSANLQKTFDARNGYMWNKTIPKNLPGSANAVFFEDIIVGSNAAGFTFMGSDPVTLWAISLKPGQEGTMLYNKNWTRPKADLTLEFMAASSEDRVFTLWAKEDRTHYGFNLDTGEKIWGPTPTQNYLDIFGMHTAIAYGKYISLGMSGQTYCYDAKTGAILWKYSYRDPLNEVLWANDWSLQPLFFADGKLYLGQSEHSPVNPLPRGAPFVCLNSTTGEVIWSVTGMFRSTDWGGQAIIADSIIATMDTYDQQVYTIGKGPSQTSVTASPKTSTYGSSVIIEGTVTDISAGTKQSGQAARFPDGVPAVSDESMSEWMLYVYKQLPRPTNATGVPVTISVIDANGNYRDIGKATSDADGFFSFNWKPDIEGKYTVYASFTGSQSYWPSHAVTAFNVDPAAPTPAPTAEPVQSTADIYFVPAVAGIIVAIAIGFAITILVLKKRP
jgi:hypothetical protein